MFMIKKIKKKARLLNIRKVHMPKNSVQNIFNVINKHSFVEKYPSLI